MPQPNGESTYLKKLNFDPNLGKSFIAKYLTNIRLVLLLVLTITFLGIASYLNLPRNLNPEIKIPMVIVSTVLPGASPKDIESLVTVPLEDAINGIPGINLMASTSRDSVSIISIEFQSGIDPDKARADVQSAVDSVNDLPTDAQAPQVLKLDFENQPIWSFILAGAEDTPSLYRFAKRLKDEIESLPSVDRVDISGIEEQEIQILIKPEVLSLYRINPMQISQAIKSSTSSLPAGSVRTGNSNFGLSIDPAIVTIEDIRNLRISLNGTIISLADIAVVSERSKPNQNPSYAVTADKPISKTVSFNVYRTTNSPIERTVHEADEKAQEVIKESGNGFNLLSTVDYGEMIEEQFGHLQRDLVLTILLVTFILFVFLGLRQSVVSTLTAPLTFFITFVIMNITGIALSFIAVFSLLLSLGLLVDDAIVIISAMTAYSRSGKFSPQQTGLLVWKDFLTPVFTTTITTVWAFLPLLLAGGIIGEFIKPIPIVVSSTLLASLFVAVLITLPLMVFLLKPQVPQRVKVLVRLLFSILTVIAFYLLIPKENNLLLLEILAFLIFLLVAVQVRKPLLGKIADKLNLKSKNQNRLQSFIDEGVISLYRISALYKRLIIRILLSKSARIKTMVMVIIFSLFSYLLFPLGFVKYEFFPRTDADNLYVTLELPAGTNTEKTREEALKILAELKETPEFEFVTANIGQSFSAFGGAEQGESNQALFSLKLKPKDEREQASYDIANLLRQKFVSYQTGRVLVSELTSGPPAGADLQIKLFGSDLAALDQYATDIQNFLSSQPGVTNINKSIKPGTSKLTFVPDQQKMAQNGLSQDQIGFWLRFYASGFTADNITLEGSNNEKIDINLRLNHQTPEVNNLSSLNIPTANGNLPLTSLGTIKLEPNPTLITRENSNRTLSVTASVTKGTSVQETNQRLERFADNLNLPSGYSWQTGGVNEENQRSVNSILQAMLLSILLIITTMVVQFSSFRKALIIILVIPLSIAGVFILFALSQTPLSFPALIGILALFGIVVKNSILVVDKITANDKIGLDFIESIADGAASRLEPIALTSLAAIAGLIPITLSDPLWRGLGGAIIAGLTFSGSIMLLFIPVVYYYFFRSEAVKAK